MFSYPFRMPSVTATILIINRNKTDFEASSFCLGLRSPDAGVYPNRWCISGGFLEAKYKDIHPGETVTQAAVREVLEETNMVIREEDLVLFGQNSNPDTDPRAHVVNLWFYAEVDDEQSKTAKAGDDLQQLQWHWIGSRDIPELSFNHNEIMIKGLQKWREDQLNAIQKDTNVTHKSNQPLLCYTKSNRVALAVARCQPLHQGHTGIFNKMIEDYDVVIWGMGSVNATQTQYDPWSEEARKQMIRNVYGNRIKIVPLADLGASQGSDDWVEYVLDKIQKLGLPSPTDYFTGSVADSIWYKNKFWDGFVTDPILHHPSSEKYFVDVNGERTLRRLHLVDRSLNPVPPATDIRTLLKTRNDGWKTWVPQVNHKLVEGLYPDKFKVRLPQSHNPQ